MISDNVVCSLFINDCSFLSLSSIAILRPGARSVLYWYFSLLRSFIFVLQLYDWSCQSLLVICGHYCHFLHLKTREKFISNLGNKRQRILECFLMARRLLTGTQCSPLSSYLLSQHHFISEVNFTKKKNNNLIENQFHWNMVSVKVFVFFASAVTNPVVIVLVTTLRIDRSQLWPGPG